MGKRPVGEVMGLSKYKQKRAFGSTPEPTGGKAGSRGLRFVVQKHKASRLHYDFRLEMDGVLKSWAVPKGPSLNPADKRLAMEVEDHPYDYRNFEGIIPKGNYGAGTVIVWDEGTYEPIEQVRGKAAREKLLLKQLNEGSLKFRLKGKKLQGEFALVRTRGDMGDNAWLLIKHKDNFAEKRDITKADTSVKSGKTLEEVAAKPGAVYRTAAKSAKAGAKRTGTRQAVKKQVENQLKPDIAESPEPQADVPALLKKAKKATFPKAFPPMLATLVDEPFDNPGWEYEVKWDGYRAIGFRNGRKVELKSRNDKSFNDKFYPVLQALKAWDISAVVDGEIVAVDERGIAGFNRLQNWRSEADGELRYYLFDIPWLDGKDLTGLPLRDRKAILDSVIPGNGIIRSGFSIQAKGNEFFDVASKMGLEGIIAKRSASVYYPGDRSKDWLKIKVQKRQEVVIGGYTRNEGSSKPFSSLLLGYYEKGKLKYAGKVGTGFKDKEQREMLAKFKTLKRKTSPFDTTPDYNKPSRFRPNPPDATATWLKPELVCEIHFAEITGDGVFRHPAFIAMREDKKAGEVIREAAVPLDTDSLPGKSSEPAKRIIQPARGGRRTLLNPTDKTQVRKIGGHELKFTNLDKVFWPDEGYTKRDLINYYY